MTISAATQTAANAFNAESPTKSVSRREFLSYLWGASLALFLAESSGALIWFVLPKFRAGEYGGLFSLTPGTLPAVGTSPQPHPEAKFWLTTTKQGLLALSAVCVHLGCLFKWSEVDHKFECPCHGSEYQADGTYIRGPAGRSLDRFVIQVTTPTKTIQTPSDGGPVSIAEAVTIEVDTGSKILGKSHG